MWSGPAAAARTPSASTIDTFHDPEGGALRGTNTIHILEAGGLRLAHFGDIGCPLTPQQREALSGLDVALIPVGGFYTIGPEEAKALMREISPKITVPMHYRMGDVGLPAIAELDDFLSLVGHYIYHHLSPRQFSHHKRRDRSPDRGAHLPRLSTPPAKKRRGSLPRRFFLPYSARECSLRMRLLPPKALSIMERNFSRSSGRVPFRGR